MSPYGQVLQPAVSEVQPRSGDVQLGSVQLMVVHVAPVKQDTSHAQDAPQLTSRHDWLPLQLTLHRPDPQVIPWQLRNPVQLIAHDMVLGQVMPLRHELGVEHRTSQFHPAGQTTAWAQPPLRLQSIAQVLVPGSHDVHPGGQTCASPSGLASSSRGASTGSVSTSTHNPSTQTRLSAQAVWLSQVKSPLRWLTEQPARARHPRAVSQSASFMAFLRT